MNVEVSNPELDGDTQVVNKGLVLSYVLEAVKWSRIT
jgi:hypothetical protein